MYIVYYAIESCDFAILFSWYIALGKTGERGLMHGIETFTRDYHYQLTNATLAHVCAFLVSCTSCL